MTTVAARVQRTVTPPAAAMAAGFGLAVVAGVATVVDARLGVAVAMAALAVAIALRDLALTIAVWAALTVFARDPAFGRASMAAGLLVVFAALLNVRAGRISVAALAVHRRLVAILAALLAWLTLSLAWAQDPGVAAGKLVDWYVNAAALLVLLTAVQTRRDIRVVLLGVVFGVACAVALAFAGYGAATPDAGNRLAGVLGDPNFLAALIVPAFVLAVALRAVAAPAVRGLLVPVALLLLAGLAATQSRGGLLAVVVTCAVALAIMRGRRRAVLGAAGIVVVLFAAWLSVNPATLDRLRSAEQDRGNGREDLWLVGWRMSGDHPVTGVGLRNFTVRSPEYVRRPGGLQYVDLIVDRPHVVHNTYLHMLAETGIVGVTLFLALAAAILASARDAARRFERLGERSLALLARGSLVATLGLLTAAIFISAQETASVWVLLATGPMLLGVARALEARTLVRPGGRAALPARGRG